jgi:hypothetical protein
MPLFPDPNGGAMTVSNEAEARARGWTPAMGSFGANSYPTGGGGGGGTPVQGGALSQDQQDFLNASKGTSGFNIKDLEEKKRQFDLDLAFKKQQWEQAGLPAAEVARRVAEAQIAEIQNQIAMAQANVSGIYNGAPTEAARQFNARTGLDYLTQAAQLGGPGDYFQQSNFFRGAQGNPQVPTFLSALQNGVTMSGFGATGTQAPDVQSTANLASRLTGMPQPGGATTPAGGDAALGLIGAIGRTGGTGLAPQAIEQLTPDELALFGSGLKASGFSMPTFLQSYRQSRVGQNAAVPLG